MAENPPAEGEDSALREFGACLWDLLVDRDLTAATLGDRIGVDRSLVQRWVRGQAVPGVTSEHVPNIATTLRLTSLERQQLLAAQRYSLITRYLESEQFLPPTAAAEAGAVVFARYIKPYLGLPPRLPPTHTLRRRLAHAAPVIAALLVLGFLVFSPLSDDLRKAVTTAMAPAPTATAVTVLVEVTRVVEATPIAQVRPPIPSEGPSVGPTPESPGTTVRPGPGTPTAPTGTPSPCVSAGTTAYSQVVLQDGPTAYWRLNEMCGTTAYDSSGNGHDAIIEGDVTVGGAGIEGNPGDGAMSFDGSTGYLDLANLAGLPAGASSYTLEAWAKVKSDKDNGLIGWGDFGSTAQANALRTIGSTALVNYWWAMDLETGTIPDLRGTWHHIVASYDGKTRRIYLDGTEKASDNPVAPSVGLSNFRIGSTNLEEYLNGDLDEVAVYNYALSTGRILAHYQVGATAPTPPTR